MYSKRIIYNLNCFSVQIIVITTEKHFLVLTTFWQLLKQPWTWTLFIPDQQKQKKNEKYP